MYSAVVRFLLSLAFSVLFILVEAAHAAPGQASPPGLINLPPGILKQLERSGEADVLVRADVSDIRSDLALKRHAYGLKFNNGALIAEAARRYGERKQQLLAGLPSRPGLLVRDYPHLPVLHMRVDQAELDAILVQGNVLIDENRSVWPVLTQSLPLIEADQAHAAGATGSGTAVAVLDTGVDYTRSAFGSCAAAGDPGCKVIVSLDMAPEDNLRDDPAVSYHGTNVAGIVAGVAPDTGIIGLDVFDGGEAYYSDILEAMDWVVQNRDVYNIVALNMSLGDGELYETPCNRDILAITVTDLKEAGVASAIAAGNDGYLDGLASPACAPDGLSVGAVYDSAMGPISWSSCYDGSTAADIVTCFSNSADYLTLLAPGARITAAGITMGGTSQAAPHVAGAVAVLQQGSGPLSVDEVANRLVNSGVPVIDARNNITTPRLDLYEALELSAPLIGFSPAAFSFNLIAGGILPSMQTLNVTNDGIDPLYWTADESTSWLDLSPPASGMDNGTVDLAVNTSSLAVGVHGGEITITAPGASNSPQTVPVTLTVFDPAYVEDFEAWPSLDLDWLTGGDGSWFSQDAVVYSGNEAIQSPAMGDNGVSYLEITLNITTPGYVYFWLKTSTEPQWDQLKFWVDGNNAGKWDGWHGENDWMQVISSYEITAGLHTFRWEYSKDSTGSAGSDAVWLDDIVFPDFCLNLPALADGEYYSTVQEAYDEMTGGELALQGYGSFQEDVFFDHPLDLILAGGFDCDFAVNEGQWSTIDGSLTISDGTVTVDQLIIQ